MSPSVIQNAVVSDSPHQPQGDSSALESSSYSTLMNGFGLWSNNVVKKSGSEDGTADAEDEEVGEEYLYEEPVLATVEPVSVAENNKKKKGGFLQKLRNRAARGKKEKKERHIEESLNSVGTKSCLPTLSLPRRSYPVQITVTEGEEHNDYEIDELDEEEMAIESNKKAQWNRIKTLEWMTEQRIKDAMSRDETESICSADGIPILPPLEADSNTSKKVKKQSVGGRPRDLTKIKPQFVQASKNQSALDAVRKEIDALVMQQVVASEPDTTRATAEADLADESAEQVEEDVPKPKRAGWSLFSAKSQEEPKDEPTTPETADLEVSVEEPAAPATAELQESSKKGNGWSMFSWKSKDKEQPDKDDCDEEEVYDDEDEESEDGSVDSASLDDDYTRTALSLASDDETRNTKMSVAENSKK